MTVILILIPLLAVIAILAGADARAAARNATGMMLLAGLGLAGLWAMGVEAGFKFAPLVLSKPEIRLALDL